MADTIMDELLPCAFCGGKTEVVKWHNAREGHFVDCSNYECGVNPQCCGDTKAETIAAWNTRASAARQPVACNSGEMEEMLFQALQLRYHEKDRSAAKYLVGIVTIGDKQPVEPVETMANTIERCERCNWPLVAEGEAGCWKGNCSMRPMPPLRAARKPVATVEDGL